jgi:hypothetical protein
MPSIDPIVKQELTIRLLDYALQNKTDVSEGLNPVVDKILIIKLSLLNGMSKASITGMLNDMIECNWLTRDATHEAISITDEGLIVRNRMNENVQAKKRTKELRRVK